MMANGMGYLAAEGITDLGKPHGSGHKPPQSASEPFLGFCRL